MTKMEPAARAENRSPSLNCPVRIRVRARGSLFIKVWSMTFPKLAKSQNTTLCFMWLYNQALSASTAVEDRPLNISSQELRG